MNRFLSAFLLSTSMFAAACAAEAVDGGAGSGTPERGIGKADGLFGSCFDEGEATCDGPAAEGNCWCDESCTDFGDCCSDKAEACGGEEPPPQPQLCMSDDACDDGQICDHSECLSGCSTDEVCPAVCFGECVDSFPGGAACFNQCMAACDDVGNGACAELCNEQCSPEPEEPECDCEEDEVCVPLCPVCAAGTPPEDCQCTSTCVDQFPGIDFPGAACFNQCMAGCDDAGTGACAQMCNEQCEQ